MDGEKKGGNKRVVCHCDVDAAYASFERVERGIDEATPIGVQQWNNLIAVDHAARAKGVSKMCSASEAKRICPEMLVMHVDTIGSESNPKVSLERYRRASERVMALLSRFAPGHVERASIDEAYCDLSSEVLRIFSSDPLPCSREAREGELASHIAGSSYSLSNPNDISLFVGAAIVSRMRSCLKEELGISVSAGISHTKQAAKLVSALNKPDKQTVCPENGISSVMVDLPLNQVRGLGGKLGRAVMENEGIERADELQQLSLEHLQHKYGNESGSWLHRVSRGVEDEPVQPNLIPKSINACKSMEAKTRDEVDEWLFLLSSELAERLEADRSKHKRYAKTLTLHYRTRSEGERSKTGPMPTCSNGPGMDAVYSASRALFNKTINSLPSTRLAMCVSWFPLIFVELRILNLTGLHHIARSGAQDFVDLPAKPIENFFGRQREESNEKEPRLAEEHQKRRANTERAEQEGGESVTYAREKDEKKEEEPSSTTWCEECSKHIPVESKAEHDDYHLAVQLSDGGEFAQTSVMALAKTRNMASGKRKRSQQQLKMSAERGQRSSRA